jgi:hypothetical protein
LNVRKNHKASVSYINNKFPLLCSITLHTILQKRGKEEEEEEEGEEEEEKKKFPLPGSKFLNNCVIGSMWQTVYS